ncbi:MAG: beta-lactamase [Caulobacteraceae bacterium]|jgi:CubicO group peptidase (beta-lactamase class C family)|nr:beta-lactamase [Caulobacteraceae bacterium]
MRFLCLVFLLAATWSGAVLAKPAAGLDAVTAAVRAGTYQQVTSVLVARHGKLVFEQYFDAGSAAALRNTRSATKTITGVLVRAAVDRSLLTPQSRILLRCLPASPPRPNNGRRTA